jgi:hypothetical protein
MNHLLRFPFLVLVFSFVVLWLSARIGASFRDLEEHERGDFEAVRAAIITLLALIIGFTFSMASSRYDQRKNLEEAEANAIGTECVRADFLPAENAARVRGLLNSYLDQRLLYYETRDERQLGQINTTTARLESALWSTVQVPAAAQPTQVAALVVSGMNDVLNSRGYTQAAWINRIPSAAWALMITIAICCNLLLGFGARGTRARTKLLFVLPLVVSISFALIADIDSPRGGVVRVHPQNLQSVRQSLDAHR